jgi:hypothetical protein
LDLDLEFSVRWVLNSGVVGLEFLLGCDLGEHGWSSSDVLAVVDVFPSSSDLGLASLDHRSIF